MGQDSLSVATIVVKHITVGVLLALCSSLRSGSGIGRLVDSSRSFERIVAT